MPPRYVMLCSAAVALVAVATDAKAAAEAPELPAPFRRLAGGGDSSSSSTSSSNEKPKLKEPTLFVYKAPVTPAACTTALSTSSVSMFLEAGNSNKKTNWNDAKLGHAQYKCLEPMIKRHFQYEKAISYAWCVYPHCAERCPGAECPVHDTVTKCQSAVKNWLGYAERKKASPDVSEAQKYYDEAIAAWPENCGALAYRAELELQKGNTASAKGKLSALCADPACSDRDAVREGATTFWQHGNLGRANVPLACDWALGLEVASSAAGHCADFAWLLAFVGSTVWAAGLAM